MNSLLRSVTRAPVINQISGANSDGRPAEINKDKSEMTLIIEGYKKAASIGILPHEKEAPQEIVIDAQITLAMSSEEKKYSDDISETVSYIDIINLYDDRISKGHVNLVETLLHQLAADCFSFDDRIKAVDITVKKPEARNDETLVGARLSQERAYA